MSYLVNSYIVGPTGIAPGQQEYTAAGTYTWIAPDGVTNVSVVAIGGGGAGGAMGQSGAATRMAGGSGGGLGWKNNISVTPGASYTVVVGGGQSRVTANVAPDAYPGVHTTGNSYFINVSTVAGFGGTGPSGSSGASANVVGGNFVGDGGGKGATANGTQVGAWGGGGAGGYLCWWRWWRW